MRWLRHPLFAPVLVLAGLAWGTAVLVFLLVGPNLGGWATAVLTYCFGWSASTRAYRLDAVLLTTLQPPLFALVVAVFYADEMRAFLRGVGGRAVSAVALLGFTAAAGALVVTGDVVTGAHAAAPGTPVREGRPAPRAALTDHRARAFDPGAPQGRPLALTFIYTDCHASCPALVSTLKAAEAQVGERAVFAAVTLDPARDTAPVLAAYAERWQLGPAWRLLTGEAGEVTRLRQAYQVAAERLPSGDIAHPNVVVVLDGRGRVAYTHRGLALDGAALAAELTRLAGERS